MHPSAALATPTLLARAGGPARPWVLRSVPCPIRWGRLVLTHFSQRYDDGAARLLRDAAAAYDGDIVLAADLDRVPVPPR